MTPPRGPFDPELLLAQAGGVRRLARSLLPRDLHLAEDVAQEACLAALEKEPRSDLPLAAWLAAAVRNLVLQHRRGSARRGARERDAASPEAQPSALEHVERLSEHAAVVQAVLGLAEPYRETIVLRFFEDLSPSAIARRQGVPVATVKTRLARGLERLRAKLDRAHGGDGRAWLAALIPISNPSGGLAAPTLGALLVTTNVKIAIACVAIACGVVAFWPSRAKETPALASGSTQETPLAAPEAKRSEERSLLAVDEPSSGREAAAAPLVAAGTAPAAVAAPAKLLQGRVLDATVRPQAGVRVQFRVGRNAISSREFNVPKRAPPADAPAATTDAAGGFELPLPETWGQLAVADERWTTVLAGLCGPDSTGPDHVVVVAPRLVHAGRVTDPYGQPLAGARVEIRLPRDLRVAFPHILDGSTECGWIAESDAQGRFAFDEAPRVEGAKLVVGLEGYLTATQPAPETSDPALEIVLQRPEVAEGTVGGQVLDGRGSPVAGARVTLGRQSLAVSDPNGVFAVAIPKEGPRTPWIALKEGLQPALQDASPSVQSGRPAAGEFVVLRLGPPPLAISGRVVDAEDRPQRGFKVFLADPTYFGAFDEVPAHVEGLLSGAAGRAEMERAMASAPAGSDAEELLRDTSSVFWTFVRTGEDGRFRIEGLLDREYRVAALDPATLLRVETEPIPAGRDDVSIRLPKDAFLEDVRGRVLTRAGEPVAGVSVSPNHEVMTVQIDEHSRSTFNVGARATTTDAEGRFAFARLPRENVYLKITGESILPLDWARKADGGIAAAAHGKVDEIAIVVALRYHLQVEVDAGSADEVRVVDADGKPVAINVFEGNATMSLDSLPLLAGRSKVMVVGEEARTLVLSKEGQEARRMPLALRPGELNVVR